MSPLHRSLLAGLGIALTVATTNSALAQGTTYYWNKANTSPALTWSNSGNANWTASPTGTTYVAWPGATYNAEIVTANATIGMGGSAVTAASLVVDNGLSLGGAAGSNSTGLIVTGANGSSGSGSFSLVDNTGFTNSFFMRFASTNSADAGFNGAVTVNALTSAAQGSGSAGYGNGLVLGADTYNGTNPVAYYGTGTGTRVALNGGNLLLGIGVAYASGATPVSATIGELSGTGNIGFQNIASSNGGTRTLNVNQSTTTTFSGAIGGTTITQTSNILAVTKAGTGTLSLNNVTGGYAGTTTVNAGTLNLSGTLGNTAAPGTGIVNQGGFVVANNATLGLSGTMNVAAASNITLAAGGTLAVPGLLTFTCPGSSTSVGLALNGNASLSLSPIAGSTLIAFGNTSMIGSTTGGAGSIAVTFSGTSVTPGTTYNLINFGGTAIGIPAADFVLSQASSANGFAGNLGYFGLNGADANTLQFTATAVPEPSAAVIPSLLAGWLLYRARRGRGWVFVPAAK